MHESTGRVHYLFEIQEVPCASSPSFDAELAHELASGDGFPAAGLSAQDVEKLTPEAFLAKLKQVGIETIEKIHARP